MNKEELIQRLTPLVRTTFGNESLVLNDAMNASNTEGWTSLNFMRLLEAVEKEFGFKFKMMELFNLKTMGNIIDSVTTHMA